MKFVKRFSLSLVPAALVSGAAMAQVDTAAAVGIIDGNVGTVAAVGVAILGLYFTARVFGYIKLA